MTGSHDDRREIPADEFSRGEALLGYTEMTWEEFTAAGRYDHGGNGFTITGDWSEDELAELARSCTWTVDGEIVEPEFRQAGQ